MRGQEEVLKQAFNSWFQFPFVAFWQFQLFKQRNFCTKPFVNIPIYLPIVRQLGKFTRIWSKAD